MKRKKVTKRDYDTFTQDKENQRIINQTVKRE